MNQDIKKMLEERTERSRSWKVDHTPAANQEVTIEQTNHKFLFGTAAFDLVPLASGELCRVRQTNRPKDGQKRSPCSFNAATLPFYWQASNRSTANRSQTKSKTPPAGVVDRDMVTKGHPLRWHTLTADWLLSDEQRRNSTGPDRPHPT